MMGTSDKWLVAALVVSIVIMAILIVLCSCLFPGAMESNSVTQSAIMGFMFGKMLVM